MSGLPLSSVVTRLNNFAPLYLAEAWDNVGLLVQPSTDKMINKLMLTNDLTQDVMDEAIRNRFDMVVSYHPPIFSGMKKLLTSSWKENLIIQCIENKIAVYSPHTSWDAINGGVNDWLVQAFEPNVAASVPITSSYAAAPLNKYTHIITVPLPFDPEGKHVIRELLRVAAGDSTYVEESMLAASGKELVTILCSDEKLTGIVNVLQHPHMTTDGIRIQKLEKNILPNCGMGRFVTLTDCISVHDLIPVIKNHLGVQNLRIGFSVTHTLNTQVKTIAVCAGSGSSVIGSSKADILLTGEMSHHQVLDAQHRGATVILSEHSHTERGFLMYVQPKICGLLENQVDVLVSGCDKDPLSYV
ncbi:NIF3-like protein 1 isoform X2 [Artemia franciscana]